MNNGFWDKLPRPAWVLAPMADVTDAAFRRIIAKYGKPDVMWTEFVSADGLARAPEEGRKKLLKDLEYSESERPIVAQLFSSNPEYMESASKLVAELGFDGVDINMGCPDRNVNKQGAGAALIRDPKLARELIRSAKRGVESAGKNIPVSVKTRAGYNKEELEEWIPELLKENPAVLTLHARIRKDMSKVPARWELVKRTVEIRDSLGSDTLIFGNGDIKDIQDAKEKAKESGADGVMLGRAIFGNPWLFNSVCTDRKNTEVFSGENLPGSRAAALRDDFSCQYKPNLEERLRVMVEHTRAFEELLGGYKNFALMKKHYKAYVKDFDGALELRVRLMEAESAREVEKVVNEFIKNL